MLDVTQCRKRQERLRQRMAALELEAVVCGWAPNVYWLSGHWTWWQHQSAVILFRDGPTWLCTANAPVLDRAADEAVSYEAQWMSTLRQEQANVVGDLVVHALNSEGVGRCGLDGSAVSAKVATWRTPAHEIDADLWQLRRVKESDERALMRKAIDCCEAMYRRAREMIRPGVEELEVFGELHKAAVKTAGEPLSALLGNDYACGVPGGPARGGRRAEAGELYILDVGPVYRGYFADNARTIAVDRKPTQEQIKAWEAVKGALGVVERMARPGVRCREIFTAVDEHFKRTRGTGMGHHLGHGVGLQPHEFPHLNPRWDDALMEGEVFTAEPGQYGPELRGGIRLENQYLVTKDGAANLTPFALGLDS